MKDIEAKVASIAGILEGSRLASDRVEICIKGAVYGFPAALEAFSPHFPFGVNYFVETTIVDDPHLQGEQLVMPLRLSIAPRHARGILARLKRLLLFEPHGQLLKQERMDKAFICQYNREDEARRFGRYPGIDDKLIALQRCSNFTELLIKTDAGLYLSQQVSFASLDIDICRETFHLLGELGQVIFDAF
jgi:hypothetical protein